MPILADIGAVLGVLFVIVFIVAPAIIKAIQQAKENQQRDRARPRSNKSASSGDELTAFLTSLSGKTSAGRPTQAARPASHQRAQPEIPVARPARPATPPKKAKPLTAARPTQEKKRKPLSDLRLTETDNLQPVPVAAVTHKTAVETLASILSKEPLKQAIVLREILGPCRAKQRYRHGRW